MDFHDFKTLRFLGKSGVYLIHPPQIMCRPRTSARSEVGTAERDHWVRPSGWGYTSGPLDRFGTNNRLNPTQQLK